MKNKSFVYGVLSVAIPFAGYLVFFLLGFAPSRMLEPFVYVPLLAFNAVGFVLSVIALALSNPTPVDVTPPIRAGSVLGSLAIFANTLAIEIVLFKTVL